MRPWSLRILRQISLLALSLLQLLIELGSDEICSARCTHYGIINVFRGYTVIEAFICRECGEGVSVERPVQ